MRKNEMFSLCSSVFGLNNINRFLNRNSISVLLYHGITHDNDFLAEENFLQVKESNFKSQMEYLVRNYNVVSLPNALSNKTQKPKVVVTFDDGYLNNYTVAFPILKKLEIPATIFLVTSTIDQDHYFWFDKLWLSLREQKTTSQLTQIINQFKYIHPNMVDDAVAHYLFCNQVALGNFAENYRTLRYSEITEMANSGLITFGSHTHNHELLPHLTDEESYKTMHTSFEKIVAVPGGVPFFCYPNGYNEERHRQMCHQVGYQGSVLATDGAWNKNTELMAIPRRPIGRGTTLLDFKSIVSGAHNFIKTCLNKRPLNVTKERYALLQAEMQS